MTPIPCEEAPHPAACGIAAPWPSDPDEPPPPVDWVDAGASFTPLTDAAPRAPAAPMPPPSTPMPPPSAPMPPPTAPALLPVPPVPPPMVPPAPTSTPAAPLWTLWTLDQFFDVETPRSWADMPPALREAFWARVHERFAAEDTTPPARSPDSIDVTLWVLTVLSLRSPTMIGVCTIWLIVSVLVYQRGERHGMISLLCMLLSMLVATWFALAPYLG